eukprot:SAG31_NODE_20333_length_577_cov_1.192469_1_plen_117_part_01
MASCYLTPNPTITFFLFERFQKMFMDHNKRRKRAVGMVRSVAETGKGTREVEVMIDEGRATPNQDLIAGFVSKSVAAIATFPIQKGQAMMQGTGAYPNIFAALSENLREHGFFGLYT